MQITKAFLSLVQQQLAPRGVLRAAINLSNPLLIEKKKGEPLVTTTTGVSPSLAAAIADRLQVPLELVEYDHPDLICTAAEEYNSNAGGARSNNIDNDIKGRPWDIALIAADPDRASFIDFTPAYCEIQATFMVPLTSPITKFDDINQENVNVMVKGGGAYDLWLSRNYNKATYIRTETLDDSYDAYIESDDNQINVLAGLRPRLLQDLEKASSSQHRLLDGSFMAVQQAIGCFKHGASDDSKSPGHAFLCEFVDEVRKPGNIVEQTIDKHGVTGRLSLPQQIV